MVHGLPCSLHWFDAITELLRDDFRIIRVDLRGQGLTGGEHGLESAAQTATVATVLDHLDVTNAVAVGHSFGADIAVGLGETTQRIGKVVIVGQAPDYSYASYPPGLAQLASAPMVKLAQRLSPASVIRLCTKIAFAPKFRYKRVPGLADQVVEDFRAIAPATARVALVVRRDELAARPLDARIRELGLPAMAIHGRQDRLFDCVATVARYTAAGVVVNVVEGAGHSPHVERPAEVSDLLRKFITGTAHTPQGEH